MVWDRLHVYSFLKRHTGFRRFVMRVDQLFNRREASRSDLSRLSEVSLAATGLATTVVRPGEQARDIAEAPFPDHLRGEFLQFGAAPRWPQSLTRIEGGRALGIHGVPTTKDGAIVSDLAWGPHQVVTSSLEHLVAAAEEGMRLRPRHLEGRAALLSTSFGRGYFHWLVDVLPRIDALEACGLKPADLDHVIVPTTIAPFQKETLAALGFVREQLVSSLRYRHLVASELLVPSLVRPTGPIPGWACDFLRRAISPTPPASGPAPERLLITRKATDHGFSGSGAAISNWSRRNGFEPIALEDFTMAEKAWLLGHTKVLLGESGAGLANVVFCQPGSRLIEITHEREPDPVFWDLASRCGHSYRTVSEGRFPSSGIEGSLDAALVGLDL